MADVVWLTEVGPKFLVSECSSIDLERIDSEAVLGVSLPTVLLPVLYEFLQPNAWTLLLMGEITWADLHTSHLEFVMEYLHTLEKLLYLVSPICLQNFCTQ